MNDNDKKIISDLRDNGPLKYYNPTGTPVLDERMFGSSPTGFVDFNRARYNWSSNIYELMEANTWFTKEVNTSKEGANFAALSDNEKGVYRAVFAQLSFNDSAQEEHILDFRRLATNKVVQSTLTLQSYQEANHSKSYAVLLDKAGNSNEVFDLYKTDDALNEKNHRIAEQFGMNIVGNSADKMLLSAMASINLEGVYFLLGFSYIYTLGDKVPGARDMIRFIARDELNTHLPLFANIFKTIKKENKIKIETLEKCNKMMDEAVQTELTFGKYLLEMYPILGLTEELIVDTVHNYANARLKAIGLDPIYQEKEKTYLQKLVQKNLDMKDIKTNPFEGNVANYAKNSIDLDDF